jgi:pilus assembly protein Flp/PilA
MAYRGDAATALQRPESTGGHMERLRPFRAALAHDIDTSDGQGLAEYALILALIAIIAIIALIFLGGQISQILSEVGNSM